MMKIIFLVGNQGCAAMPPLGQLFGQQPNQTPLPMGYYPVGQQSGPPVVSTSSGPPEVVQQNGPPPAGR